MRKISILLLLISFSGLANAQFQSDDEVVTAALNQKISQNLGRHHISLGILGYFKSTSGDFELPGFDLSQGTGQFLNYRYSFDKNIDLAVDVRAWGSTEEIDGLKCEVTSGGVGLGVRYNLGNAGGRFFPYIQANGYSLTEQYKWSYSGISVSGNNEDPAVGFGINGGFEIKFGKLISIPIEANYLYGKPLDDISGYGFTAGISFNWGDIN